MGQPNVPVGWPTLGLANLLAYDEVEVVEILRRGSAGGWRYSVEGAAVVEADMKIRAPKPAERYSL
jgi:hypothetical protein